MPLFSLVTEQYHALHSLAHYPGDIEVRTCLCSHRYRPDNDAALSSLPHAAPVFDVALPRSPPKPGRSQPNSRRLPAGDSQRFPLSRCRRSADLIMVETSTEKALARSASVRAVGLLVPRSSWPM